MIYTDNNATTRVDDEVIKEMLPMAQEMDIVIAIENVWNKFLLYIHFHENRIFVNSI